MRSFMRLVAGAAVVAAAAIAVSIASGGETTADTDAYKSLGMSADDASTDAYKALGK